MELLKWGGESLTDGLAELFRLCMDLKDNSIDVFISLQWDSSVSLKRNKSSEHIRKRKEWLSVQRLE